MPAKSEKQRRFLFATKGAAWVKKHHFDRLRRRRKKN
jgi:hypothetical protein